MGISTSDSHFFLSFGRVDSYHAPAQCSAVEPQKPAPLQQLPNGEFLQLYPLAPPQEPSRDAFEVPDG